MRVAVIGAGCAGLCVTKHSIEAGLDVQVYEQTGQIGGTWVYRDEVGTDEFGLNIHSSMYQGVVTNLPREIMCFPDLPMTEGNRSFVTSEYMLRYFNRYADFFNLKTYIKFHHHVLRVTPKGKTQWHVVVKDLKSKTTVMKVFDVIFICNGRNASPLIPNYPGQDIFYGHQLHSHDYRSKNIFCGQRVLVVGAGASAVDLVNDATKMADFVAQSHNWEETVDIFTSINLVKKHPKILRLTHDGVIFSDGTQESFTMIVYCTGYRYSFPFLTPECEVSYENHYVTPLYQHCININRPTMAFVGLCQYVVSPQVMDLQARFALKFIVGDKSLPSRKKMLACEQYEILRRLKVGLHPRKFHSLGPLLEDYVHELATIADIKPLLPVVLRIAKETIYLTKKYKIHFRKFNFTIIDDETFDLTLPIC